MNHPLLGRATIARLALLALLLPTLAGCEGCHRQIRFQPAENTPALHSADSLRALIRQAQDLWEQPDGGEQAAAATAAILREDLQVHADQPWDQRARTFLDSLDCGAEIRADRRVLAVNLFARSRPDAGAWPWLYWRTRNGIAWHALAGRNLQLVQVSARPDSTGSADGWTQAAVLFGRRAAAGQEPLLTVWNPPGNGVWAPIQALGPDSLGGMGTVQFQAEGDTAIVAVSRTFRGMPRFEECATCPHVYTIHRFRWMPEGFVRVEDRAVPSPYATFVQFVLALGAGDQNAAAALVTDPALLEQARLFDFAALPKGMWRTAPATEDNTSTMVLFRGQQEAYQVSFEPRGDTWLISAIKQTTRSIE
jgi:hypothetical protein